MRINPIVGCLAAWVPLLIAAYLISLIFQAMGATQTVAIVGGIIAMGAVGFLLGILSARS